MSLGKKLLHEDRLGLISPERMAEITAEAKEKVKEKLRKAAEAKLLDSEMTRIEREADPRPEYEMRSIIIDCAEHTDVIRIDNQHFYYGQKYEVSKPVYDQLIDIMSRGFMHEREISTPTRAIRSMNRGVVLHGADQGQGVRF